MSLNIVHVDAPGVVGVGFDAVINTDPATGAGQTAGNTLIGPVTETAPASDTASSGLNGRLQRIAQRLTSLIALWTAGAGTAAAALRVTLASDDPLVALSARGGVAEVTSTITRPADTTAYAVGDAWSNSTSAPTAGGGTLSNVVAVSGGSAELMHLAIVSSAAPATPLQGEIWIFDTAPTAINDNAAFTVSDAEMLNCIAQIPFALSSIGANSSATILLGLGIKTIGSANLRYLIRVANVYTPASGETLSVRAFFRGLN